MTSYLQVGSIKVSGVLHDFVVNEALPETNIDAACFFSGLEKIIQELAPRNAALLQRRAELQKQIDLWHRENRYFDATRYESFLTAIGYLLPEEPFFGVQAIGVDDEIAAISAPQLVVPVSNRRFAVNAVNARWGSLYDALYGTDALEPVLIDGSFDARRATRVVKYCRSFLDTAVPLDRGSFFQVSSFRVESSRLVVKFADNSIATLRNADQFIGYLGDAGAPSSILLKNNGLHIEIRIDETNRIGATDMAGICDIMLEAALTTIIDFEDSVAIVDVDDKVAAYRNWLGLMNGTLSAEFKKGADKVKRVMAQDRSFLGLIGEPIILRGRSLQLVRHVGHHMMTDIVVTEDGRPVPEAFLDAAITSLIAMRDVRDTGGGKNSRTGSIYVVKPKMHGPDEVLLAVRLFEMVEENLGLPLKTIKIGIMDEERRTSINLAASIRPAADRVVFINTGFLDRTGDEIHTSMEAGPVVHKNDMRTQPWLAAYENNNVDVGLATGLNECGQVGKGMWTAPDRMAAMLAEKISHPRAGANTAWVPSPTAATLHALHYHSCNVTQRQNELKTRTSAARSDLLKIPIACPSKLSRRAIQNELDNNIQGILGYVVRWVDQGIGCSKVPDISNVGLMEDRATLRISSQHVANWLLHGVVTEEQVERSLRQMAVVVDRQNAHDAAYLPMTPKYDGEAFQAARDLVFLGRHQPSGYTEWILHERRLRAKKSSAASRCNQKNPPSVGGATSFSR